MRDYLIIFGLLVLVGIIYVPLLGIAKRDIAERTREGKSSTIVFLFLFLPIVGPLVYLLVRKRL